jgi:hypothetical protein
MDLKIFVSDRDVVIKLISWGFHKFIADKYGITYFPENAKLVCKDNLTGELVFTNKQDYLQNASNYHIMILYVIINDDGFDWDDAIAQAIGMVEASENSELLIEEIKRRAHQS